MCIERIVRILGWAFYLASSWTWCIGMFLPVLLIRDYGVYGWVVFAVPNVLGACAMAYVLIKPGTSIEIVEKHKTSCIVFSVVTILFQIYFIGWISTVVSATFMIIIGIILFVIYIGGLTIERNQLFSAFIVCILSLLCFILTFYFVPVEKIDLFKDTITNTNALLYLAPVCVFGFLLCPYLDLTFHKARQSNTLLNSKIAFTIGFCLIFLLMILFTFFYARPLANIIEGVPYFLKDQNQLPLIYIYLVVFHILIQAGFTIILHFRSILPMIKNNNRVSLCLSILSIIFFILPIIFNKNQTFLDLTINEIIYRSFMAFYSLIAPVYVFLFVISKDSRNTSLSKNNLLIFITVILFALPFYAIAFLGAKWNLEILLLIGLAIVLYSKRLVKSKNVTS